MAQALTQFDRFHREVLPARLAAGNGALAFGDARRIGSLAIRTPEGAYTYAIGDGTIDVVPGDDDALTAIELDAEAWAGLVQDLDTAPGLLYGGRVHLVRGNPLRFVRWEPALRAMFHGRPIFDPEAVDLRTRDGAPLDPADSFTLTDLAKRPDEARHFLDTAGYLLARGVFSAAEVDGLLTDAAALAAEAREGDKQSWWGLDAAGASVLCRVLRAATRPRLRALYGDERIRSLIALAPEPLVARRTDGVDAATVLWKRSNIREGLADLPWHRDCGMGGHARNCPTVVITICLTDGSAEAGELRVLPGSHRGSYPFVDGTDKQAPRGVSLGTTRGDVSLHFSDVMHASMPPTSTAGPHRISVLLSFTPPAAGHHRGERHYNDVLLSRDDGQVEHLVDHVGRRSW